MSTTRPLKHTGIQPSVGWRALRLFRLGMWALLLLAVGIVVVFNLLPRSSGLPVKLPAATFALTDQDSRPFSSQQLHGKPWVAAFFFTSCGDVCPRLTTALAGIQGSLSHDVQLVSFSVSPETDTPAVLKKYAADYHADETRWRFLTGRSSDVQGVMTTMKLAFKPADRQGPVSHSEKLLLVDADGNVRGLYDSQDPQEMKRLTVDGNQLAADARRGSIGKLLSIPVRSSADNGQEGRRS